MRFFELLLLEQEDFCHGTPRPSASSMVGTNTKNPKKPRENKEGLYILLKKQNVSVELYPFLQDPGTRLSKVSTTFKSNKYFPNPLFTDQMVVN